MKAVGERIKQARHFRGMSGQELAEKVGYKTQSGIANLENRSNGSGGHALAKIAEVLNFSLDWFLTGPDTDDLTTVPPYGAARKLVHANHHSTRIEEPSPSQYESPRLRARRLIDAINDQGLLIALEVLEGLAERHPIDSTHGAGVHVPAHDKRAA